MKFIIFFFSLLTLSIFDVILKQSIAGDLVGYQAIYKMRLVKASLSSRFSAINGSAVSIFQRDCGGWLAKEEMVLDFHTAVGEVVRRDLKFTSWEAFDGLSYRFSSIARTNGTEERYEGTAEKVLGGAGEAVFTGIHNLSYNLPNDTVFYAGLIQWLLSVAESGIQHAETWVFDGVDEGGPEKVVAFVMAFKNSRSQQLPESFDRFTDRKRWTVRLAFYKPSSSSELPEYEMEIDIVENGILTGFRIYFEDFTVMQTLEDIAFLDAKVC